MTNQMPYEQQDGLLLPGLDGTNPLGFLAALGLFRAIDDMLSPQSIGMRWLPGNGTWIPCLVGAGLNEEALLDLLENKLAQEIGKHPVQVIEQLGNKNSAERVALFQKNSCKSAIDDRVSADWLVALASDATPATAINQLQTARRDYYYGNLSSVISRTKRGHLGRAIFSSWDYADALDNQSLHWDPSEDRRHAHQWNKPAGDPDRKTTGGMLGANRLAIEAIVWFYSLPVGDTLRTLGFTGQRSHNTRWTWPIWDVEISTSTVHSVLMLAELQHDEISINTRAKLRQRGVIAAFRTARILVGKTPNFTPAQRVA